MNKFIKVCLMTAGGLLFAGILMVAISGFVGGKKLIKIITEDKNLVGRIENLAGNVEDIVNQVADGDFAFALNFDEEKGLIINGEEVEIISVSESQKISVDEVVALNLNLGAGTLNIVEKDVQDGIIDMEMDGVGNCNYSIEEGTLYIEGFEGIQIVGNTVNLNKIVLRVPKDYHFKQIQAEVGAGIMNVDNIKVSELETEIGAGEMKLEAVEAITFSTEIGAGKLTADEMQVKDADIAISMGDCSFDGNITGDLTAECDMGNLNMFLSGKEADHNYEVECAAGNIDIGDFSFAGLASEKSIDNNVSSNFDIECNMGNISINFED